jgi:rod shape-determining protein MreD
MKLYLKIFFNFLLVLALAAIQIGFVSSLPGWLSKANLIIIFIIFVLELSDLRSAVIIAFSCGLILDVYSFSPFGSYSFGLLVVVLLTNFLLNSFFTDRSLYSFLVLTFFAFFCFELTFYFFDFIVNFINRNDYSYLFNSKFFIKKIEELFVNLSVVFIGFYILGFATNKLNPVFLVKRKK